MEFKEILLEKSGGVARININRPEKYNACTSTTVYELTQAFTDGVAGITHLGVGGLSMYYDTEESMEGKNAFMEKRKPDFSKFR